MWGRMEPRNRFAVVVIAIMHVAFLVVVVGTGVLYWIEGAALSAKGMPSVATVTAVGGRSQISFAWTVAGKEFEASDGSGYRGRFALGQQIPIRYLPERPDLAHFDWGRLEWRGKFLVLLGVPFWSLSIWITVRKLRGQYGTTSSTGRKRSVD